MNTRVQSRQVAFNEYQSTEYTGSFSRVQSTQVAEGPVSGHTRYVYVMVTSEEITTNRQIDRQTHRQTERQTHRQTDRKTDRQTERQTDRQTDRQPYH